MFLPSYVKNFWSVDAVVEFCMDLWNIPEKIEVTSLQPKV